MSPAKLVALGGGHGLYASLSALRRVTTDLTAIVTVADDGGSSGRLRSEMGIVPPGDLRMALSALCDEGEWGTMWRDVLQTRFDSDGPLSGHAVGNLLIAGLWQHTGDVVEGLEWVARLLKAQGSVLPLAQEPLEISATVQSRGFERLVRGQAAVARASGQVTRLMIDPQEPHVPLQTLDAVDTADAIVLGPGSWFTSVLVHFLVEPMAKVLCTNSKRAVVVLNIAHEDAETSGQDRADDIASLRAIAPNFAPGVVVVDSDHDDEKLRRAVSEWGARLVVADIRQEGTLDRHDHDKLSRCLSDILDSNPDLFAAREVAG